MNAPDTSEWISNSPEETAAVGGRLATRLLPDGVLLLRGELAAGKTVLTRGLAVELGISAAAVQSPSYTLIHEHQGDQGDLIHIDLYRLESEDVLGLGLEELLERPAVKVIEWPDRLPFAIPGAIQLELLSDGPGRRKVRVLEADS